MKIEDKMWQGLVRVGVALWLMGLVRLAVWHQPPPAHAQSAGAHTLHLPLIQNDHRAYNPALHDYVGLVEVGDYPEIDYFTVRGDSRDWTLLAAGAQAWRKFNHGEPWSPDGAHLVYSRYTDKHLFIVPLATGEPQPITSGTLSIIEWSPDSQRVAVVVAEASGDERFVVYNVQTAVIELSVPMGRITAKNIYWSPNSEHVAWMYGSDIWLWEGGTTAARLIWRQTFETKFYWAPDSSYFLFNGHRRVGTEEVIYTIYRVMASDSSAGALRDDSYLMEGWLNNGRDLLLYHNGSSSLHPGLYTAPPEVNATPLLLARGGSEGAASPRGDGFYYYYGYLNRRFYNLATNNDFQLPFGHWHVPFAWLHDGDLLLSYGAFSSPARPVHYQTALTNMRTTPPTVMLIVEDYAPVPLLPLTAPSIGLHHTVLPTDYIASYLYEVAAHRFHRIRYPADAQYPVVAWRYMP